MSDDEAYRRTKLGETEKHKTRRPQRNMDTIGYKEICDACDRFFKSRGLSKNYTLGDMRFGREEPED